MSTAKKSRDLVGKLRNESHIKFCFWDSLLNFTWSRDSTGGFSDNAFNCEVLMMDKNRDGLPRGIMLL